MTLNAPFEISSRLMPALTIAGAVLSLGFGDPTDDGRIEYEIWLDLPHGQELKITGCCSGVGGGTIQSGFESILSFLSAAAESHRYRINTGRAGENENLFAPAIVEWAFHNSSEIEMLAAQIEGRSLIQD